MKPITIVFDGDDTLWMNEWQYSKAYAECSAYVYKIFNRHSPNFHFIYKRLFEIDHDNFTKYGVKMNRLSKTFVQLYEEVKAYAEKRFRFFIGTLDDRAHKEYVAALGKEPFDFTHIEWLPEVPTLLEEYKNRGHTLCLLSSYDTQLFPKRVEYFNARRFFENRTRATEHRKTKDDFIAVSGWTKEGDAHRVWIAVGNGEADIHPALDISENWHGIFVPHGSTSKFFEQREAVDFLKEIKLNHERVHTIRSLREFPKALDALLATV